MLTLLAGFLIGLNREARGHSAGLRTTILAGLAACVAMVQRQHAARCLRQRAGLLSRAWM
ncbi:MgtC/SapB family protein [Mesorhizobium atlanticum]